MANAVARTTISERQREQYLDARTQFVETAKHMKRLVVISYSRRA